jgi:antibiotic biosynthesis monooxygenase (ABM) superfamily enzyme
MPRYTLRTLLIVLAIGPMVLAWMWANRNNLGSIAPIIVDLIFLLGLCTLGAMFVMYAVAVAIWALGYFRR